MGLFCVNFHVRTTDDKAAGIALRARGSAGQHVLAAKGGWTSLYEEQASTQDETRIREIASGLSEDLSAATIAFLVHDSDIACYWLFDRGQLLDEFNSFPDYFSHVDTSGPGGPSGGRPNVLRQFCRRGVSEDDLAAILAEQPTFAEDLIEPLANALGIDPERALSDYRDLADGDGPSGWGGFDDGGDDDGDGGDDGGSGADDGEPHVLRFPSELAGQVARRLAGDSPSADDATPQAAALVSAAAAGDLAEIDRLLGEGAAIDAEAPAPLPAGAASAGLAQLLPGGLPQFSMTPLLAAALHQKVAAVERLLTGGADPNHIHQMWGTPAHIAAGAGNVELLRLLLDRGARTSIVNRQGQTPLAVIATSRATVERLTQAKSMLKMLGMKMPGLVDQLSAAALPTAGWDACEQLLKSRSG